MRRSEFITPGTARRRFARWAAFGLFASYLGSLMVDPGLAVACSTTTIGVQRVSASVMYIDTGITPQLRGSYVGYKITNTGSSIADAWVQLGNFAGGVVGLAADEDGRYHVGPLNAGGSAFAYFYLVASGSTAAPQTHDVAVYSGHPALGGTQLCTEGFSIATVDETIKANANKVNTVVAGPNPAELGGVMTMTVTGQTGQVGDGPPGHPNGKGVFIATPATAPTWPANAYQLVDVRLTFATSGTYHDTLVVSGLNGTSQNYTAVYTFVAVGTTVAPSSVTPVNYIASGTQIKHTDTSGFAADLAPILPTENKLTLAKAAAPTSLPPTGGTVQYTVTVSNAGTVTATLDDFVDVLPAGASYVSNSARFNGTPIANPYVSGQTLSFVGLFSVPAGGSSSLTYSATLPGTPGSYVNSAVGHVGTTQIDTTLDTTDPSPASATVQVGAPATPPTANDDSASTAEDTAVLIDLDANDTDPNGDLDPTSVSITSPPSHGSVTNHGDGSVTYEPDDDWNGTDTFQYEICDLATQCDTGTVTVTVTPVADAPVAVDDSPFTLEDTPATFDLAANDTDADNNLDPSSLTILSGPTDGVAVDNGDGTIGYTPDPDFSGTDSLVYQICDSTSPTPLCDTATVTITVTGVNEPPVANPDAISTPEDTAVLIGVAANDTDPDGNLDPASVTITLDPGHGTITNHLDGTVTYTPAADYFGTDSFEYRICDLEGLCSLTTALVTTTVVPVDDAPIAGDDTPSTSEDTPATFDLAANDTDADGNLEPATLTILTGPSHGSVSNNGDGTIDYTPDPGWFGTDTLTYQICDSTSPTPLCDTATATITVNGIDEAPTAGPDATATDAGTPVTIDVSANDTDPDGNLDPTSVSITVLPTTGVATNHGDGTITVDYSGTPAFTGTDTLTYQICDTTAPTPLCDTATVTITVDPVPHPPVAVDDPVTTPEDTPATFNLAGNDTDVDVNLDPATLTILSGPTSGGVTNNGNGTIDYTPDPGWFGTDTITYQICDTTALCDTATVTITVTGVDEAPTANPDARVTGEDVAVVIDLAGNDTDPDDNLDPTGVTITNPPDHGTITNHGDGTVTFTPDPDYFGPDSFDYQICDTTSPTPLCDTATVTLSVVEVNDLPDAVDDPVTTPEDTPATFDLTANDDDVDGNLDPTSLTILSGPSHGTATNNGDGTIDYDPAPNWYGTDTLTYQVCDTDAECAVATVTIVVTPVDDPPVADDDARSTPEDTAVTVNVADNDSDVDGNLAPASVTIVSGPSSGTATPNGDGTVTYTPDPNTFGPDAFTYQICDSTAPTPLCDTATVSIIVDEVDDAPVAADDTITVDEDDSVVVNVVANDGDVDGDLAPASVTVTVDPADGTAVPNGDGTVTYTPDPDFNGTDTFTYQVCDTTGLCDTAVVTVTVDPVGDAPVAVDDATTLPEDGSVTVDVVFNDTDPDGDIVAAGVVIVTGPSHGTIVLGGDGTITYTPDPDYSGPDTLTYRVCDASAPAPLCDEADLSLTVTPVADPPIAADDTVVTAEDSATVINVTGNDVDPDDDLDPTSVAISSPPGHGSATVDPVTGSIVYSPASDWHGTDSFTYRVCDADLVCVTATVTVTVYAVNDAPVAADDSASTLEEQPITIDVLANDGDIDSLLNSGSVTTLATPLSGTATVDPGTGAITYTPAPDWSGVVSLTYRVCDTGGACDTATITIVVHPVNDPPVRTNVATLAVEVGAGSDALTFVDPETDLFGATVLEGALPVGLTLNPDGTFTGTATVPGTYTSTIEVCDVHGACTQSTLVIVVAAQAIGLLPFTGIQLTGLAALALALITLGGLMVMRTKTTADRTGS